jgi:hypothetical protein
MRQAVVAARDELAAEDLVAYRTPLTQVLSLPLSTRVQRGGLAIAGDRHCQAQDGSRRTERHPMPGDSSPCPPPETTQRAVFLFRRRVAEQGAIDTDWPTAEWHEKEKPKRRRRRSVLPEAYRRLPKSERRQVRAARHQVSRQVRRTQANLRWQQVSSEEIRQWPAPMGGSPCERPRSLYNYRPAW